MNNAPFDPLEFDLEVLLSSLLDTSNKEFMDSCVPVNLVTRVTYTPHIQPKTLITDGHLPHEHPFIWGFEDLAPFYLRLRIYLMHWLNIIKADIVEVRITSDQFEEVICAKSRLERWRHNGGPPLAIM